MRLAKFLADAGTASRRQAEKYIAEGRIRVNGVTINTQGYSVNSQDVIEFDGKVVESQEKVYLLLNKPAGYISSVSDPQGRPTVVDLITDITARIYPVGRLDFDTEGLLLLTNDGEFSNLMMHPRYSINKKYEAWVEGEVKSETIKALVNGVLLEDGMTAPAQVRVAARKSNLTLIEMEIHEGRKRQVKRMCQAVGCRVVELRRIAFACLDLKGVGRGKYRHLSDSEVDRLKAIATQ